MLRFAALFVALVAGVGAAVWYDRAVPEAGRPAVIIAGNGDRWLDDSAEPVPKDAERASAELEQRGTAALPVIRRR